MTGFKENHVEAAALSWLADIVYTDLYGSDISPDGHAPERARCFTKYLGNALSHASFIGFTGTPIDKEDVNTPAVFDEFIDVYDINRAS